jgi:hypothetical protein
MSSVSYHYANNGAVARIPETRDYELVLKRYLESNLQAKGRRAEPKLRLVTVKVNLKTGPFPPSHVLCRS